MSADIKKRLRDWLNYVSSGGEEEVQDALDRIEQLERERDELKHMAKSAGETVAAREREMARDDERYVVSFRALEQQLTEARAEIERKNAALQIADRALSNSPATYEYEIPIIRAALTAPAQAEHNTCGCACVIDVDGKTILEACKAHAEWAAQVRQPDAEREAERRGYRLGEENSARVARAYAECTTDPREKSVALAIAEEIERGG